MKLIQMLVLAAALTLIAAGQNTGAGANSGPQAVKSPTPASPAKPAGKGPPASGKAGSQPKPTPATVGTTAGAQGGTKTAAGTAAASKKAATKTPTGTGTGAAAGSAKPGATGAPGVVAPTKPPVAVGTMPGAATPATKKAAAKKATAEGPVRVHAKKAGPFTAKPVKPVVPAKVNPPVKAAPAKTPEVAPVVAEKKPAPRLGANGRRDPFVSPIRAITSNGPGASCTTGKRCLSIPEVVLQGTVKDISGKMMAVVVSSAHRTYTLRENDQVFNGSVEKITTDSIIFREFVKDALGHETAREVVKRLGPSS